MIAYYFPPVAASGAFRPLSFCRYLEEYGWRPRILTTDPQSVWPPLYNDPELCRLLPTHLQIERVPHRTPLRDLIRVRSQVRTLSRWIYQPHVNDDPIGSPGVDDGAGISDHIVKLRNVVQERTFSFPDPQCFWFRPALRRMVKLFSNERPDVVLATGKPWTSLLLGRAIAKRFRVPFLADFRDPWLRNPHLLAGAYLTRAARKLERRICSSASRVVTTTQELRDQLAADYPHLKDKFITITNGFDGLQCEELLCGDGSARIYPLKRTPILELAHFGSISGNRTPEPLLQAIKELAAEKRIQHGDIRVRFIGDWSLTYGSGGLLAEELEGQGFVRREPPLPHEVCLEQMSRTSVLLLLQSGYPMQIPAKLYEYIAIGRPILLVGGTGATANIVNRYGLGVYCPEEILQIKQTLMLLITGKITINPVPITVRNRFDYRNLAGELAAVFDEVSTGKVPAQMCSRIP